MFDWREGQSVAYLLYRQIIVIDCRAGARHSQTVLPNDDDPVAGGFRRQVAERGLGRLRVPTQLRRKRVAAF